MIKTFEKIKRTSTRQNVEKNEFNQTHCEQEFLRIVHRNQAKNRIAQQFRDSRQAFSEFNVKRFRSIFYIQRQNQVLRDVFMRLYQAINDLCALCQIRHV